MITQRMLFVSCCLMVCSLLTAQPLAPNPEGGTKVEQRVNDLLSRMTPEEKVDMLGGYETFCILPNARLGIPKIVMADGPLGVRNYGDATAFPAPVGIAASWDPELMNEVGTAVGKEARAKGVHIMLAPGLNIYRAPMCGRNFEYLGEDPFLAARMAVAYVKGVQSQGVVATAKHFAANNQEWDRHTISSDLDERTMQEIYLPAFRAAVTEGAAGAVMTSYNLVNGVHASQNTHLLRDILKGEWKFDGIVMSDWVSTYDGVAAANAGLDLEMPSGQFMNRATLLPAIRDGTVKQDVVDDKIRRMLRVMIKMGFLDRPQLDTLLPRYSPASRLVALKAAQESIVLLKNQGGALPLDRSAITSIAVIGPNAYPAVTGGGGSSRVKPFRSVSVLDGMIAEAGDGVKVYYAQGFSAVNTEIFKRSLFQTGDEAGLRGEYFKNMDLEGTPAFTRVDKTIEFLWNDGPAQGFPKEQYSVRWTGTIRVDADGVYEFTAAGDDGYRLFVDGRPVVNEWRDQSVTTATKSVRLTAGREYQIRFEYYQNGGDAIVGLGWGKEAKQIDASALAIARRADAAVVCVGFDQDSEGEGFDRSFGLAPEQEALIKAVAASNRRTIVVVIAGGNVGIARWIDNVAAVIHAWYPGQEGGTAIADVLFGDVNPSGRLPASFEKRWEDNASYRSYYDEDSDKHVKYTEGIFLGYRHFDRGTVEPLFAFGYGLSYTTFEYSNFVIGKGPLKDGGALEMKFDVTNTGKREGAEVAQLYIGQKSPGEPRPVKELKGFSRVVLMPGEKRTVSMQITPGDLAYFSAKNDAWVREPGEFNVMIGSSSRLIRFTKQFTFAGGK